MRLSIGLLILASATGCSLLHSVEPNPPRDMSGCTPGCMLDGGSINDDMSVNVDGGPCETICPSVDMEPDLRPSCVDSSTCSASAPVCMNGKCGICTPSSDMGVSAECTAYHAPANLCGPMGGCVQCLSKDDCAQFNQTCILATGPTMNTCGPCSVNADCTTGVCKSGGGCASPSEVYYVDNRSAATIAACKTAHPTADGTSRASAFCDITDATGSSSPRPYVVVQGSATSYGALSLNATIATIGPMTIIGPGHNATPTAKIAPTTGPAVSLATSGSNATLTINGLELIGAGGGSPAAGAKCQVITSGTPTLTIVNSYIHNSGLYGADAASCALALDANIIYQNTGGGISISGGSVVASNNLIVGNGSNGPGVSFAGSVSGTWWFNTVAGNTFKTGPTTNPGAFTCSTTGQTLPVLQAGIVWGNDKASGASFDASRCVLTYTDIDDSTTPAGGGNLGNFNMDPMLTSGALPATGYRIPSSSPCKDKVTSATGLTGGTLPSHDVDGNARPRTSTGGYDCGGSQAP